MNISKANRQPKPIDGFNRLIQSQAMQNYLQSALHERRDQFVANITALVGSNPQLQACDPAAVIMTAIKATALNLSLDPSLGFAYVIPYASQVGMVPQFQLGYKGYLQLALRSGQLRHFNAREVREGEIVGEDYLSGELTFQSVPGRESRPVVGYVAYLELINGFSKSLYMSRADMEAHASRFSKTYRGGRGGVWGSDFDKMGIKTVTRMLLSKYSPLTPDLALALASDGSSYSGADMPQPIYVDNDGVIVEDKPRDIAAEIMGDKPAEEGAEA